MRFTGGFFTFLSTVTEREADPDQRSFTLR